MESGTASFRTRIAVATVLAAAVVIAAVSLGQSLVHVFRIKHGDKTIVVTGSMKRRIVSDRIVWQATVVGRGPELAAAYRTMAAGTPKVIAFIEQRGVDPKSIITSAVRIREIHPKDKEGHDVEEAIALYSVEQDIEIESADVEKVATISRESSQLIEQGIQIQSEAPKYLYTKLAELKIELLAQAAKDARLRADQIAANTGAKVAHLSQAKMGVMQVNAANSSTATADGVNDTTSKEKDVLAIVTATFGVD